MNEGDELVAMIREAVTHHPIPAEQREHVVVIVAHTIIAVMSQPRFLHRLNIVQQLEAENMALKQQLMTLQAFLRQSAPKPSKTPPKKKPAKKATAKKTVARNPSVRVRGSTTANRRAFKQGYQGAS